MGIYQMRLEGEWHVLCKSGTDLLTPGKRVVKTKYKALADRLILDLKKHGEDPTNPLSIVAFHYPMIDFFSDGSRGELERSISIGLDRGSDWTLECPSAEPNFWMRWLGVFGNGQQQSEEGKKWLSQISPMQLCAVSMALLAAFPA